MKNKSILSFLVLTISLSVTLAMSAFAQDNSSDGQAPEAPEASLFVDNFTYSGLLTNNGWAAHSGAATNPIATTTGLTFAGYPGSGTGNAILIGNGGGEDDSMLLSTSQTANGTIYYSMLVNVNDTATDKAGDYFFHIGTRASTTSFVAFAARLFARTVGGNVNFGISNGSTAPVYGSTNFSRNTTYLVIVKYTLNTAGNDPVSLWVIPAASGVPATEAAAGTPEATETTTAGQDIIDALAVRQGSNTASTQEVVDGIRVGTAWADITGAAAAIKHVRGDYDGDGKTDYGLIRAGGVPSNPRQVSWYIKYNGGADLRRDWGLDSDIAAPADYDGDGKEDIAVWRANSTPSYFYILRSSDSTIQITAFGVLGDGPVSRDYTGDGKADVAVYRPAASATQPGTFWYLPTSGPFVGRPVAVPFGATGDLAYPGDFNGDGKADFAVFHNAGGNTGAFNIRTGTDSTTQGTDSTTYFGKFSTDVPVPGDFDGDGKSDLALTRIEGNNMIWYYLPSSGGQYQRISWGLGGNQDFQVPGDYDGDGKTDVAIWRPSNTSGATAFWVLGSTSGFIYQQWGLNTDTPANFDVVQ